MKRFIELDAEDRLLEDAVNMSFELLYSNDKYLINHKACERSIVFRFAHYLQSELEKAKKYRGYTLDCEFNRNIGDPKLIYEDGTGVYPDLIIHKRGKNDNNLLIIEFKTYWNNDTTEDESKIRRFVSMDGNYKYKYGFSAVFLDKYPEVKRIKI